MSLRLYGKSHRLRSCAAWTVLVAAATSLAGGRYVELPAIWAAFSVPIAAPMLVAFLIGPAIASSFQTPALKLEALSKRQLYSPDLLLLAAVVVPTLIVAGCAHVLFDSQAGMQVVREVFFLSSLTIITSVFVTTTFAAAMPALYVMVAVTLGSEPSHPAQWWSFLRVAPEPSHLVVAISTLLVSWVLYTWFSRKVTSKNRQSDF